MSTEILRQDYVDSLWKGTEIKLTSELMNETCGILWTWLVEIEGLGLIIYLFLSFFIYLYVNKLLFSSWYHNTESLPILNPTQVPQLYAKFSLENKYHA